MAYILLNSGVEAGLERGLYILLDGSQSNAKSDLTEGQSTALPGPGLSHLTGRRLINVLYRIFVDGAWSPEIRRLVRLDTLSLAE
ncbi:hypothetical protein BDV28DRAFT_126673 [Aspergillus coremiiformis]|uniref:Uncharacterized protein n=1 Tax=Aspergillus coremiiformis TaxID=138285 RepID=A0A5N6ZGN9_9EURO|nr:hypothetical protein BDV28DRAFT_126673 [Aspergillus coremiiformis]